VTRNTILALWLAASVTTAPAFGQTPRTGTLLVTVTDQSRGVIPSAVVQVTREDVASGPTKLPPVKTSDRGLATIADLAPGRYSIQVEFPGFDIGLLKNVQVGLGDNKHVVVLGLNKVQESVQVSRDQQAAAADRRVTFGTALTQQEILVLSDDPAEMAQQLIDLAGGNAIIKIDGFTGGPLPPKAMIKLIHIIRDTFAAENHSAESDEIDIITQPGVGPWHGGGSSRLRDGALSGRSPFTPVKGPEQTRNYDANVGGTLIPEKASFSVSGGSRRSYDTPNLNVALPGGTQAGILNLRRPNDSWTTYDLFDYALTKDQVLRTSYDQTNGTRKNLGVGAYDLQERAFTSASQDGEFRIQEAGPLGRRMFIDTRLQLHRSNSLSQSSLEAITIRVADAFTSGGAQVSGGRHAKDFEFASDLDYIRGIHSVRAGVLLEGGRFRSDDASNYLGTFSFTSLAAYNAGQPATFTRRIGNPLIDYWNLNAGVYIQDDIRVNKGLTLSPGVRYEAQTHVRDYGNVHPRFGFTWAPFPSGKTTLRSSVGVFSNWLNTGTYEQTLRVDGVRQRDVILLNPAYPDAGTGGTAPPSNKYVLGPDVRLVRTVRFSAGVDQTINARVRVSATYSHVSSAHVLRGLNLNAPVAGVRPDTAFANIIEVASDASLRSQQLQSNATVNLAPLGKGAGQARWNPRRMNVRFGYTLGKADNNTDGAFSVPPSGTLATEWAPASNDRRHRYSASINSQALKNLNATISLAANTGTPYTVTTGLDDNGDLIFNDRPVGIGRNTLRTPLQYTLSANFAYAVMVGPRVSASNNAARRYRLSFTVQIANLTNHANYSGFSGVMTSPFFRTATAVQNPRKIDIGMTLTF
jgi:hypothetical protein